MYNGYTSYFGLTDIPFSIAPNPHFLFMSERHKEALAHLTYGLGEVGGFALLTGEVGTGKTTVSKCLLERLPENTQAAFIFNPTLSAKELLATICDELAIKYDSSATLKTFTDKILQHLLDNHQQGINTLLIIDEAQHLQVEVLEQLRLLTNLETHTKKLLQVILIGQPELQELLKRRDLRQLAQRITARYHLLPLNRQEVELYIKHRLAVAGCSKALFKKGAINLIHKLSQGVPRLVNLLCDRALLGAYSQESKLVGKQHVLQASTEALGNDLSSATIWKNKWLKVSCASLLSISFMTSAYYITERELKIIEQDKLQQLATLNEQAKQQQLQRLNTVPNGLINQSRSLSKAFKSIYSLWQVDLFQGEQTPCDVASDFQLECYWYQGNVDTLLTLNYPAVLQFFDEKGQAYFATLVSSNDNKVQLQLGQQSYEVSEQWLQQNWQGSAAVLWRPPALFIDKIDSDSPIELVRWLELKLSAEQNRGPRVIDSFDPLLLNQLKQFQQQAGLTVSEYADIETVMLLANSNAARGNS
ncbi:ExeA family protein [Thalassomonas sp. M1454]|uniref:ExeA family protein n=1 Tax=Thalassomonas sp. M1454 TaxID=2594477 RepID=UPI00117E07A6|nr:ExeA family protein [Thalassomonas sp. M1454]TRX53905.1 AAA family ATPase [Thalassomonas sp. M1454]